MALPYIPAVRSFYIPSQGLVFIYVKFSIAPLDLHIPKCFHWFCCFFTFRLYAAPFVWRWLCFPPLGSDAVFPSTVRETEAVEYCVFCILLFALASWAHSGGVVSKPVSMYIQELCGVLAAFSVLSVDTNDDLRYELECPSPLCCGLTSDRSIHFLVSNDQ